MDGKERGSGIFGRSRLFQLVSAVLAMRTGAMPTESEQSCVISGRPRWRTARKALLYE